MRHLIGVFFGLRLHVVQFCLHVYHSNIPLLHLRTKRNPSTECDRDKCSVSRLRIYSESQVNVVKQNQRNNNGQLKQ